ncbi:PREDICTED: apomucin-like isoform X2 [Amphimedon queenslandica]|uniref:CHHC U11-48K-type domain-containing protein n=1 Tax=Amphimedon queenslandica TaxID=400682 RepID=A0AAN0IYM7_AMPQE|nr:PREDICTED: apomucin-like isoform X2 [Amphimedon queenslandica]|eukprot:XP_019849556.1 PREDICTED: apomucin-like isoform X2 [Amphimedon queenslandica]
MEPPVDPEELISCPYEPVHMFRSKRLIYHLEKCRKNHPTSEFKKCDFNASHIVPAPEIAFHLSICPDRGRLELEVFHENHQYKQKGDTSLPQCDWTPPEASESWDGDNVRFEPKVNEQLFEEEAAKIKPSQAKPSKKPPSPEKWRMPHSLPMTGPIRTSGGRGRGRGITKKLAEAKPGPSGLQKNRGASADVAEQSSLPSGLGKSHSGSLSQGQPHPVSLLSHELEQSSLSGEPDSSSFSLSQGQPHSASSHVMGPSSLPPGLGQVGSVMSQSSLSQVQPQPLGQSPGLGQPYSGSRLNFMGHSSLSQVHPQTGGQSSLPPGMGQPYSGSSVNFMGRSSLSQVHPQTGQSSLSQVHPQTGGQSSLPPGLGQPHSGSSVNLMGQSSLSQVHPQTGGQSSLPPGGMGQPHSGSSVNLMGQSSFSHQFVGQSSLPPGMGQPHSGSNVMSQSSLPPGLGHPSLSQPVFNAFGTNGQPVGRGLAQPHMYPMALSQNPFVPASMGRGNGYGRGALCFGRGKIPLPTSTTTVNGSALNGVLQATPNGATNLKSAGINNAQSSPPAPNPSVEEMEKKEQNEEEIMKRKNIRKLKKALRQVEELELKQKSGVILTPEQFVKLNRKADLLSKLREVETDEVE